jgi:hypothetical protein
VKSGKFSRFAKVRTTQSSLVRFPRFSEFIRQVLLVRSGRCPRFATKFVGENDDFQSPLTKVRW